MRSSVSPRHGTTVPGARCRRDPAVVEPGIEYLNRSKMKIKQWMTWSSFFFFSIKWSLRNYGPTFAGGLRHQPVISWSHWWPLAISATQPVADWMRVLTRSTVEGQHTSRQPPLQREQMWLKINTEPYSKKMFDWFHFPRLCLVHPVSESEAEGLTASLVYLFFKKTNRWYKFWSVSCKYFPFSLSLIKTD